MIELATDPMVMILPPCAFIFGIHAPQDQKGTLQGDGTRPAPILKTTFLDRALVHIANPVNQSVNLVEYLEVFCHIRGIRRVQTCDARAF